MTKRKSTAIAKQEADGLSFGNLEAQIALYEKRGDIWGLLDLHAKGKAAAEYVGEHAKRGRKEHDDGMKAQGRVMATVLRIERGLGSVCARLSIKTPKRKRATCTDAVHVPTLDEVGISRNESSRWQRLARMSPEQFEERVAIVLEKGRHATMSAANKAASEGKDYKGDEHYTPEEWIERVRDVLGEIDLDPCSCELAQETVGAETFYTEQDSALTKEWRGRVFMNPPYSKPLPFVEQLLAACSTGAVPEAIVLVNNSTDAPWAQSLLECASAVCFLRKRIAFNRPKKKGGISIGNKGTRQGQIFFYIGNDPDAFVAAFADFGVCMRPPGPLHVPDAPDEEREAAE